MERNSIVIVGTWITRVAFSNACRHYKKHSTDIPLGESSSKSDKSFICISVHSSYYTQ